MRSIRSSCEQTPRQCHTVLEARVAQFITIDTIYPPNQLRDFFRIQFIREQTKFRGQSRQSFGSRDRQQGCGAPLQSTNKSDTLNAEPRSRIGPGLPASADEITDALAVEP